MGTAAYLRVNGVNVVKLNKLAEESPNIMDAIKQGWVQLLVNTITRGKEPERDGFQIRRASVEHNVPCLTSLDTVKAFLQVLIALEDGLQPDSAIPLQEYRTYRVTQVV
jgi:carbamoyl-phosphate synthase large subunit